MAIERQTSPVPTPVLVLLGLSNAFHTSLSYPLKLTKTKQAYVALKKTIAMFFLK